VKNLCVILPAPQKFFNTRNNAGHYGDLSSKTERFTTQLLGHWTVNKITLAVRKRYVSNLGEH